jgi:hypothetical protein
VSWSLGRSLTISSQPIAGSLAMIASRTVRRALSGAFAIGATRKTYARFEVYAF